MCNSKCCQLDGIVDDVVVKAMQVDDVQLIDAVPEQLLQLHVQLVQLSMNGAQGHMTSPIRILFLIRYQQPPLPLQVC